jgi:CheY-like chemotaxis protein
MQDKQILVVEDEEDILELVSFNLKKQGYQVKGVTSGEEALQEARRKIPSLIILDLMLPGVDGFDVCKSLKNDPRTKAVPIVMLTARSEEADIVIGLELGADDYLTKPFSPRELIARVRAILRRSKADISDQEILQSAIDVCIVDAEDKNIEVQLTCPKDFFVYVNGPLLEQAIINLVMNSIKYSDEESKVLVDAGLENGGTVISVKDFGVGIAAEHLPRLFERFYRSDKARSRKLGGTGLGLSIVKHIVQVHEGNVTVDSTPGKGAIFSIHLPGSQVN